jgi:hypothetical protein
VPVCSVGARFYHGQHRDAFGSTTRLAHRFRHFAMVFEFSLYRAANSLVVACDRCIAARTGRLVVALP